MVAQRFTWFSTKNHFHNDQPNNDDIDTNNISFINDIWYVQNASVIITETAIYAPPVVFGIIGNALLIYILCKMPHIRSPTNLLIGNMALADLLSLLIHPWVFLCYDFFQNYQLGSFGCHAEGATECAILLTSVFSMTAISYDRLTAIVLPKETRLTYERVKIIIAVTWIAGLLLSIPLYVYRTYRERQWKNFLEIYCTEKTLIINIYWHVIITVLVWLPLLIQMICYISIFVKLYKYEKVILRKLHVAHQVSYKKKAVRMMVIVILTFLICHLPFTVLIFYRYQLLQNDGIDKTSNTVQNSVNGFYHTLWYISKLFIFINAALNPIIYGFTNSKIRKGFQTTKLSKWLFSFRKNKTTILQVKHQTKRVKDKENNNGNKNQQNDNNVDDNNQKDNNSPNKTSETLLNKNIFLIFKKKSSASVPEM